MSVHDKVRVAVDLFLESQEEPVSLRDQMLAMMKNNPKFKNARIRPSVEDQIKERDALFAKRQEEQARLAQERRDKGLPEPTPSWYNNRHPEENEYGYGKPGRYHGD